MPITRGVGFPGRACRHRAARQLLRSSPPAPQPWECLAAYTSPPIWGGPMAHPLLPVPGATGADEEGVCVSHCKGEEQPCATHPCFELLHPGVGDQCRDRPPEHFRGCLEATSLCGCPRHRWLCTALGTGVTLLGFISCRLFPPRLSPPDVLPTWCSRIPSSLLPQYRAVVEELPWLVLRVCRRLGGKCVGAAHHHAGALRPTVPTVT